MRNIPSPFVRAGSICAVIVLRVTAIAKAGEQARRDGPEPDEGAGETVDVGVAAGGLSLDCGRIPVRHRDTEMLPATGGLDHVAGSPRPGDVGR